MVIGYGDPERLILIVLISLSMFLVYKDPKYARVVKFIKFVPRTYLLVYYAIVTFDLYRGTVFQAIVLNGIVNVYGILLLFLAEVYLQWANLRYGRR